MDAGKLVAAFASFLIPGMGQLFQGRLLITTAIAVVDLLIIALACVGVGLLIWLPWALFCAYDAAVFERA